MVSTVAARVTLALPAEYQPLDRGADASPAWRLRRREGGEGVLMLELTPTRLVPEELLARRRASRGTDNVMHLGTALVTLPRGRAVVARDVTRGPNRELREQVIATVYHDSGTVFTLALGGVDLLVFEDAPLELMRVATAAIVTSGSDD